MDKSLCVCVCNGEGQEETDKRRFASKTTRISHYYVVRASTKIAKIDLKLNC